VASIVSLRPELGRSKWAPSAFGLDAVTGLADRGWLTRAMALSDARIEHESAELGIIAVRVARIPLVDGNDADEVEEGLLLLTAEVLHKCGRGRDLVARTGHASFAVLAHTHAAGLLEMAAKLRDALFEVGIQARVGSAMRTADDGLPGALAKATRQIGGGARSTRKAEAVVARALLTSRTAHAARILQEHATGILMHWHQCSAESARLELAHQAHELDLAVTEMARLVVAVASGEVPGADIAAHGIELERSLGAGAPKEIAAGVLLDDCNDRPGQPVRSVRPASAVRGLVAGRRVADAAQSDELRLAGRYQGASNRARSGGDWFDVFLLADGTAALVLGDVAGHDALAATAMMQLRSLLRRLAVSRDVAPSEVLHRLDRFFVELDLGLLATAFFGWVHQNDDGALVLRWCNAGHLPPVLLDADGKTSVVQCVDDLLLGLGMDIHRSDLTVVLPPGSTLLLYSDGLIETRIADLDDGIGRLCANAEPLASADVADLCDALVIAMADANSHDDVTLLAVRTPSG
jgi:GGDEF domain-containing protein